MKSNQVKSEFKIHKSVLFFDKNIDNFMKNKFLISLGYDDKFDDQGNVLQTALILKIWDFISLDDYIKSPT